MFSSSILLLANNKISFFVVNKIPLYLNTTFFKIHSSVLDHLGCFHSLAIVNNVAKITGVQVPLL
jgi:hypothetical protein